MAGALRIGHFLKDPTMIKAKTLQDLFKRYRRPGDLVFALAFMAFSLFLLFTCLLYTSPSPRDRQKSRMPSSA